MIPGIRWCSFVFFLCPIFLSVGAFAYCPVPEIRPNGEFFKADLIFTGTVLSERYTPEPNTKSGDDFGWYYRLKVGESFKGSVLKEVTIFTGDDSNRFPLAKGHDYLLFVYRRHHRLEIDRCGNSAELTEAATSIAAIRNIVTSHDGEIEGRIAPETRGVDLSGIHVIIRGPAQVYRAITDKDGYFHFRAPAGRYVVDFRNQEYYINDADDFWYGPHRFMLHSGESVTLQFVSVRHPKS